MKDDRIEQVSWNISQFLILQISSNLSTANRNYLDGNFEKAFFALKAIKFRITQHLSPDERKEFKTQEVKFGKALQARDKASKSQEFESYNELLMDKLEKYGYLISKKEDRTKLIA